MVADEPRAGEGKLVRESLGGGIAGWNGRVVLGETGIGICDGRLHT